MRSLQDFIAETRRELYRHHRKLDAPQMLPWSAGTVLVSFDGDDEYHNQQVMYGRTLPEGPNFPPSVFTNIATQASVAAGWDCRAILIGNAGFDLHVFRVGETTGESWNHVPITWVAVSPTV